MGPPNSMFDRDNNGQIAHDVLALRSEMAYLRELLLQVGRCAARESGLFGFVGESVGV